MAVIGDIALQFGSMEERTAIDLGSLVDAHAAVLFRVAYSVLRSHAEAEDAVQDTLVRALEHNRAWPEVREVRAWLIRICWNAAIDRRRRMRGEPMDDALAATLVARDPDAASTVIGAEQLQQVLAIIDRLPAAEREALLLSAIDELTTTEIAAAMQKSESAVRALVFRARQRIRERMRKGAGR